ncbi:MAG: hypothetical protein EKK64_06760 [Neisseriaceae bacterium]|nr:MAG: hypothetical protein EKK64_06760 [Neisseriaceae bacterium]
MYPFEVYDEKTKRVEFSFPIWEDYKIELFKQYPANARRRIEIELVNPEDRLKDVKTRHDWNPHAEIGKLYLNNHDCFYYNENWSVIFDVYPSHRHFSESYRFIAERGHINPLGERLTLLSTSSSIDNDNAIRYAYFRDKFWLVLNYTQYTKNNVYDLFLTEEVIHYSNETKEWYSYGVLHRDHDFPAIEYANGDKEWWSRGRRHRSEGPAIICGNKQYWYENGVYLGDQKPIGISKNSTGIPILDYEYYSSRLNFSKTFIFDSCSGLADS